MSVQSITAALNIQGVNPSEKLLLIVLANYCDHNFQAWPSQGRLAHDTSMSVRTIQRVVISLEKKGLIKRVHRYRKNMRTSDMITLLFVGDKLAGKGAKLHDKVSPNDTPNWRQGGDTVADRSFIEPLKEPSARNAPVLPLEGQPAISLEEERKARKAFAEEVRRSVGIVTRRASPPA